MVSKFCWINCKGIKISSFTHLFSKHFQCWPRPHRIKIVTALLRRSSSFFSDWRWLRMLRLTALFTLSLLRDSPHLDYCEHTKAISGDRFAVNTGLTTTSEIEPEIGSNLVAGPVLHQRFCCIINNSRGRFDLGLISARLRCQRKVKQFSFPRLKEARSVRLMTRTRDIGQRTREFANWRRTSRGQHSCVIATVRWSGFQQAFYCCSVGLIKLLY